MFSIVEENRSFGQIIGNPDAPMFNRLASQYGLATSYFGTSHPSEPNYVAMVGGSDFGITDDGSYLTNRVEAPTLASQLEQDNPAEMQKTVPIKQLTTDLAARLLAFAYGQ